MLGKYWVPSREDLVNNLKRFFLWSSMSYGFDIDNMNLNPKELEYYNKVLDNWNNPKGRHISIPKNLECVIAWRLIKENNLITDIKRKKKK